MGQGTDGSILGILDSGSTLTFDLPEIIGQGQNRDQKASLLCYITLYFTAYSTELQM